MQPLIRRSSVYSQRRQQNTDGIREVSLYLVLMMMERHRTRFDPLVRFIGGELLSPDRPTLIISTHTMLSVLIVRCLHDRGIRLTAITSGPIKVPGTDLDADVLLPSRTLLLTARRLFQSRETVSAMIDRGDVEPRQQTMTTARGDLRISTSLLELALRQRAHIVFLAGTIKGRWEVTVTLDEPPQDEHTTVEDVLAHFASFVDEHVHAKS